MPAAAKFGIVLSTILMSALVGKATAQEASEFAVVKARTQDFSSVKFAVRFPLRGGDGPLPGSRLDHGVLALANRRRILENNGEMVEQAMQQVMPPPQEQEVPAEQEQQAPAPAQDEQQQQQQVPLVVIDTGLVAGGGDPASKELANALLKASIAGDLTTVRQLVIDHGVSTEIQNMLGWTPLNLAALAGHLEVVKFLVEVNANMETREIYGQTPLGSAAINGHVHVVRYLLNQDTPANVSATDLDGAQPLHYASQFGYVDVCRALLDGGADVNARVRNGGWTPLHAAAAAGQFEVVVVLIRRGADSDATDWNGMKPIQVIGTTMDITKRRHRLIECELEPNSVADGCPPSSAPAAGNGTSPGEATNKPPRVRIEG